MKDYQYDLFRFFGKTKLSLKEKLVKRMSPELRYIILFRKAKKSGGGRIKKWYYSFRLRMLQIKTHIQIPSSTQIGKGLYIGHLGRIIINSNAVLGENINLATGIVIGQTNRGSKKGCPTIGDRVWIGANAVIVGKITIGNNVLIAPNAYVNVDVPDNSIVIGNPCVIKPCDDATEDYINNTV